MKKFLAMAIVMTLIGMTIKDFGTHTIGTHIAQIETASNY